MGAAELAHYRHCTGRHQPPDRRAREVWTIVGRRGGKSRVAALLTVYLAVFRRYTLAHGERGVVMVLAADRRQSRLRADSTWLGTPEDRSCQWFQAKCGEYCLARYTFYEAPQFPHSTLTILRRKQVQIETGYSRSTIYLRITQGLWPKPVSLGARAVGWT